MPPPRLGAEPILEWEVRLGNRCAVLCPPLRSEDQAWRAKLVEPGPLSTSEQANRAMVCAVDSVTQRPGLQDPVASP